MRIIFVSEYYWPHIGGVEVVFSQLAQKLADRGHDCHIITCKIKGTPNFEVINGIMIHRVNVPEKGDRYWFALLAIPAIIKIARKASVIHTTTYSAAFPAWVASCILRKKCIITVHEVWGNMWNKMENMSRVSAFLHRIFERIIISLPFNKYCSVSNYTEGCLISNGINRKKCLTIYNGIDYDLFDPEYFNGIKIKSKLGLEKNFVYLYFGRPGISKGLTYLIRAVPLISQKISNARLLLIIPREISERYEKIKTLINELEIKDKVVMLDPVPRNELPDYIAASDCVIVPSLSEGFGFSAAEACAMNKPIVVSRAASLPEVVWGKHWFVEPGNSTQIAEAVENISKGNVQIIPDKVFNWDDCCKKYLQVYQELCEFGLAVNK
jgi:D-inositol-3-phosphate glycosyltransferase